MKFHRTSSGKLIQLHSLVRDLLQAIRMPEQLAIVKGKAHTEQTDEVSVGNDWADWWTKKAATNPEAPVKLMVNTATDPTDHPLLKTPEEKASWKQKAGVLGSDRIWRDQTTNLPFL